MDLAHNVSGISSAAQLISLTWHQLTFGGDGRVDEEDKLSPWLQTTQPTSGGAVTADSSCCANCVEPPRPQQWGPDLPFLGGMPAMRIHWIAGAAANKSGWCRDQSRSDNFKQESLDLWYLFFA